MDINKIIKRELPIGEGFDYKVLYNDSRGAGRKEDYKRLLSYCLKEIPLQGKIESISSRAGS